MDPAALSNLAPHHQQALAALGGLWTKILSVIGNPAFVSELLALLQKYGKG